MNNTQSNLNNPSDNETIVEPTIEPEVETFLSKAKRIGKRLILPTILVGGVSTLYALVSHTNRIGALEEDVDDLYAITDGSDSDDSEDDFDSEESED